MRNDSPGVNSPPDLEDLDRLLDAAISSYSAAEPRRGLAHRVIANAASIQGSRGGLANMVTAATWRMQHLSRLDRGFTRVYGVVVVLIFGSAAWWSVEHVHRHQFPGSAAPVNPPKASRGAADPAANSYTTALEHGPSASLRLAPPARHPASRPKHTPLDTKGTQMPEAFPTPSPLTAEERALITLATRVPQEVQQSLIESASKASLPITIAAIHVEPLAPLASPVSSGPSSNPTP